MTSYEPIFEALQPGHLVTFNDSGGANATATPELVVTHTTEFDGKPIVELESQLQGDEWTVGYEYDDEGITDTPIITRGDDHDRHDVVETVEIVACSETDQPEADRTSAVEQIRDRLEEIEADDRLQYDSANVQVNAPLALTQTSLEAKRDTLRWVLSLIEGGDTNHE